MAEPPDRELNPRAEGSEGGPLLAGRYEILRALGEGGMGSVSLARDLELGREVAIKRIGGGPVDLAKRARFEAEAQAAARLQHVNVIQTHELLSDGRGLLLVMEHVAGESLGKRLEAGPLSNELAREVTEAITAALVHAHANSVIHRDIKPDNVMLADDGRILLIDFGLAKRIDSSQALTKTGQFMGSPSYVPPEQITQSKEADARADLYGLGACLYHMLTGRPPFDGESLPALARQVLTQAPVPPRRVRAEADPALAAICLRCLQKSPDDRFASAVELQAALQAGAAPRGPAWAGWLALGLGIVGLLGLAVALQFEEPQPSPPPLRASPSATATPLPSREVFRPLTLRRKQTIELAGEPYGNQDRAGLSWGLEGGVVVGIRRDPQQLSRWVLGGEAPTATWRLGLDWFAAGPEGLQLAVAEGPAIHYFANVSRRDEKSVQLVPTRWPERWSCDGLAFSPSGTQLVVASRDAGIALLELPSGDLAQWIEARLPFRSCAVSASGRYLLAGFGGGREGVGGVGLWNLKSGSLIERQGFPGAAWVVPLGEGRVALGGKSSFLAIATYGEEGLGDPVFLDGGGPRVREFGGAGIARVQAHSGRVTFLTRARRFLYSSAEAAGKGELRIWDTERGALLQTLEVSGTPVRLAAHREGVLVLTAQGRVLPYLYE